MSEPRWRRPWFGSVVGAAAGLLSGLLGIGGGLVVGPALAVAGMPLPRAVGTALVVVVPVAMVGVGTELLTEPGHLVPWAALAVAVGGQLGAPLGGRLIQALPRSALRLAFVALLGYAALRNLGLLGGAPPETSLPGLAAGQLPWELALAGLAGVLAGVASSLFGIGGGVVVVPALVYVVGGFDFHAAAGTSLLAMIPTAARAAWIAHRQGRIESGVGRRLVPAALLAAAAAVTLRNTLLEPRLLAILFGLFLLYAMLRLARPVRVRDRGGSASAGGPSS